jgi:YesN/AraC family two-component response regulator
VPDRRRILIVEDEPDIRDALKDLLQASLRDVDVHTADNGQDALRILSTLRPHVIISDFKMPGMDGLQFLEASRALLPDAPKVLMTAYPDMDVAIKAINDTHIENFFQKPLDPTQVVAKLDRILQMQEAKWERERALSRSIEALKQRLAEVEGEPKG